MDAKGPEKQATAFSGTDQTRTYSQKNSLRISNRQNHKMRTMANSFYLAANPFKPHLVLSLVFVVVLVGMVAINDASIRALLLIPALILYTAVFILFLFESQMLARSIVKDLKKKEQAAAAGLLPTPVRPGA